MKFLFALLFFPVFLIADFSQQIQAPRLFSGKEDTLYVSDMIYLEPGKLDFYDNPNIYIQYDEETGQLILKPREDFSGLSIIEFSHVESVYTVPVFVKELAKIHFQYDPEKEVKSVFLFGSFNNWNRQVHPFVYNEEKKVFETDLFIEPGLYEYKFFADSEELVDPANPEKIPNPFGAFNSVLNVKKKKKKELGLYFLSKNETGSTIDFKYYLSIDKSISEFTKKNIICIYDNKKIEQDKLKISNDTLIITLSKPIKETWLKTALFYENSFTYFKGTYLGTDFQWNNSIIYSIMIDRFYDGNTDNNQPIKDTNLAESVNYQGGDFQGILKKLQEGYFEKLNINTLWLSPVNDNPNKSEQEFPPPHRYFSGYHGYWPIHHERVEEHFGSMEDLKETVQEAHKKDLRVILDFIANHTHQDHPYYQEHPEWFGQLELPDGRKNIRFWDEYRLTTWFEPYLPSFDYLGSSEALQAMTENGVYWLKETGADGFRHDAVKHVPNLFWRSLTKKLIQEIMIPEKKNIYQIGETFGDYQLISSYVNNGQLSSQFNFNIYDRAKPIFLNEESDFQILAEEMMKTVSVYGYHHVMGNIMDSHDKIRYMAYCDGDITSENEKDAAEIAWNNPPEVDYPESYDKVLLYQAFQMTIPGVPVVYYGDEIAMTGASDPDNRRMMIFDDKWNDLQKNHYDHFRKLTKVRSGHSALKQGDFIPLTADKDIFSYLRTDFNEKILVVLNKSSQSQEKEITIPDFYSFGGWEDLISDESSENSGNIMNVQLPPFGFKIFLLK